MDAFWSGIIISSVWFAASHCARTPYNTTMCTVFGFIWLAIAVIYKWVV